MTTAEIAAVANEPATFDRLARRFKLIVELCAHLELDRVLSMRKRDLTRCPSEEFLVIRDPDPGYSTLYDDDLRRVADIPTDLWRRAFDYALACRSGLVYGPDVMWTREERRNQHLFMEKNGLPTNALDVEFAIAAARSLARIGP